MTNTATTAAAWYDPLRSIPSLGSQAVKVTRLADLHEAREQHLSQFWTPNAAALYMWRIASQAIDKALMEAESDRVAILDNSIGSGRLVQFADPARHTVAGVDVDGEKLKLVAHQLESAGFRFDLLHAGMEEIHPRGFGVALLNPPFSCHLETALLRPYGCTAMGRFGPNSSAISHHYALHQALEAADVVVALVPRTAADEARNDPDLKPRLQGVLHLPGNTFASEGANVQTSILVFGHEARKGAPYIGRVDDIGVDPPAFDLYCRASWKSDPRPLQKLSVRMDEPTIRTPVTSEREVYVSRKGPEFRLKFRCGLTEAKVRNALMEARLDKFGDDKHRYPAGVDFVGQGILDVELHLMQPDPLASFANLLKRIRLAGGIPRADAGILPYLEKLVRRRAIENTPTRHWVWVPPGGDLGVPLDSADRLTASARTGHLINPKRWGSPRIEVGEQVAVLRKVGAAGERFVYGKSGVSAELTRAELLDKFTIVTVTATEGQWVLKAPGRRVTFPQNAQGLMARVRVLGIENWLTWAYQVDDLVEAGLTRGCVIGWQPGLGKGRLCVALALLGGGRRNLVVVEAQLLDEVKSELEKIQLDPSLWQMIEGPEALQDLRLINVISYTRLRMLAEGNTTYAKRLRNRVHTVIADEGHAIANDSQQVQALYQVSPKRRYALTGTPIGNYPRSLLPLAVWAIGDGTAAQPYGRRRPYLEPRLISSMSYAKRGYDAFRDKHVVVDWCTYEFLDDFSGGKREIPALAGVDDFRSFAGKLVIRRTWKEPEVAAYISVPDPEFETHTIEWDDDHLAFYLQTAEEFADWWRETRRSVGVDGKRLNLVGVLARIGGVFRALTYPQGMDWNGSRFTGRTSKQRAAVEYLSKNDAEGHKTIFYATSPDVLAMLSNDLRERGVDSVLYTGKVPLKARTRALNERFRYGNCSTLLCSFGTGQTGLNLPQANREGFYNRCWSPRQEEQALYRALRPQQVNTLGVDLFHLRGSHDLYMGTMVAMKADSSRCGLDYGTPEYSSKDFMHWLQILDSFCEDLAQLRGVSRHQLREVLSNAA